VSWWKFRVSIPFSLLCLILFTHFYKNASFQPNMRNYLNTTFTFGKQINDKFINRKVQCRPQHQFIFSFLCPIFLWGESRGQNSRRTRNTPRSTAISDSSAGSGPSKVGDVVTPPGPWTNFGPLSRGCSVDCSLKDLVRHSFQGHFGHLAELT